MFCLGLWILSRRRYEGQVFVVLMGGYALFRFLEEFLRADHRGSWAGTFSFAQLVSVILGLALLGVWAAARRRPLKEQPEYG